MLGCAGCRQWGKSCERPSRANVGIACLLAARTPPAVWLAPLSCLAGVKFLTKSVLLRLCTALVAADAPRGSRAQRSRRCAVSTALSTSVANSLLAVALARQHVSRSRQSRDCAEVSMMRPSWIAMVARGFCLRHPPPRPPLTTLSVRRADPELASNTTEMQHNEHCARGQAHAERARTKSTAGAANQADAALGALKDGIAHRHAGKVYGVIKHLEDASTDEADAVVVGLLPLVAAANEHADLDLLRKAMTHEPLGAKALARAVLACLRKDATDGTYGLALSLLDLAPKVCLVPRNSRSPRHALTLHILLTLLCYFCPFLMSRARTDSCEKLSDPTGAPPIPGVRAQVAAAHDGGGAGRTGALLGGLSLRRGGPASCDHVIRAGL
jgi:hypothetical protein